MDQMQITAGERYQQFVTPPLQRLSAAATSVQLDPHPPGMNDAARGLQYAAGRLADCARSRARDYRRAETAFSRALESFQNAAGGMR
jgi:hypothetical protein